jgi:Holliday junction resolvasome RuvABC endonuclease subunit
MKWLEGMIAKWKPDLIVFESPWIPRTPKPNAKPSKIKTTPQVLRGQITWAAVIETTAAKHGIECREVESVSAKKVMTGRGRLEDKKRDMVNAALARGFRVADDHQADACAVAMVALIEADEWRHAE